MSEIKLSKQKNHFIKIGGLLIAVVFLLGVFSIQLLQMQYSPIAATEKEKVTVTIPEQATASQIGKLLKDERLIRSETAFNIYLRQNDLATKLRPGQYGFTRSQSLQEIVEQIVQGQIIQLTFTVPEGYTVEKIGKLLVSKGVIADYQVWDQAVHKHYDYAFLPPANPRQLIPLEGYLFPDTYLVSNSSSAEDIIHMMLKNFEQKWQKEFAAEAQQKNMSLEDTIIIASMVEREALKADDRSIIAGVIQNRLDKGMLLQICATVLYSLKEEKTELSYADLQTDSPYNTYQYMGLPPGPIACPGSDAIRAALNPQQHSYYYYVAKGDGSHYFARTYQEHLDAIKLYQ